MDPEKTGAQRNAELTLDLQASLYVERRLGPGFLRWDLVLDRTIRSTIKQKSVRFSVTKKDLLETKKGLQS